jgi:hypothetical protein
VTEQLDIDELADRRKAYLETLADDAIALQDKLGEERAAAARAEAETAARREMLQHTVTRLTEERAEAVEKAEGACRSMMDAFSRVQQVQDALRSAANELGEQLPLSPIETERRLSLLLAAQLNAISRASGPTFGALNWWAMQPYDPATPWPGDLSMPMKGNGHADSEPQDQPESGEARGAGMAPHGGHPSGHPDAGLADGKS